MTFERKPVANQTLSGTSNPAYVSINQEAEDEFSISVRSQGAQTPSTIKLSRNQLNQLSRNIRFEGPGEMGTGG